MRAKPWPLVLASLAVGVALLAAGCAGKSKPTSTPAVAAPAAPPAPAPPPDTLTMSVDVTPPKPPAPKPPPPVSNPCAVLRDQLAAVNVHFELDRANISPAAVQEVDALSAAIKTSGMGPGAEFSIEGHCDATGSDGYNVALSERRARSVLDRLVDLGAINPTHAKTVGWGKQKPLDPANTPEAYARNRRVEVMVYCPVK